MICALLSRRPQATFAVVIMCIRPSVKTELASLLLQLQLLLLLLASSSARFRVDDPLAVHMDHSAVATVAPTTPQPRSIEHPLEAPSYPTHPPTHPRACKRTTHIGTPLFLSLPRLPVFFIVVSRAMGGVLWRAGCRGCFNFSSTEGGRCQRGAQLGVSPRYSRAIAEVRRRGSGNRGWLLGLPLLLPLLLLLLLLLLLMYNPNSRDYDTSTV